MIPAKAGKHIFQKEFVRVLISHETAALYNRMYPIIPNSVYFFVMFFW